MSTFTCHSSDETNDELNLQRLPAQFDEDLDTTMQSSLAKDIEQLCLRQKSFMFSKHKSFSIANLTNNNSQLKNLDSNNNSIEYDDYEFDAVNNFNSINLDDLLDDFNYSNHHNANGIDNDGDDSEVVENEYRNVNNSSKSNANPILATSTNANNAGTTTPTATTANTNNKVIRSFLKLIRPSLHRKRKNRHNHTNSTLNLSELNAIESKQASKSSKKKKSRGKLRSSRSIGVLNSPECSENHANNDIDIEIFNIKDNFKVKTPQNLGRISSFAETPDSKASNQSPVGATSSKQLANKSSNKASRTFSMINKTSMFSSSVSSCNSVSLSSTNNSGSCMTPKTPNSSCSHASPPVMSKELTWYKLQELDDYYKILGTSHFSI